MVSLLGSAALVSYAWATFLQGLCAPPPDITLSLKFFLVFAGSVLDETKRKLVLPLLYVVATLYSGMLGILIWGTMLVANYHHIERDLCASSPWVGIIHAAVFGSWAAFGLALLVGPTNTSPVWRPCF